MNVKRGRGGGGGVMPGGSTTRRIIITQHRRKQQHHHHRQLLLVPFLALLACFILAAFNIRAGFWISSSTVVEDYIIARALLSVPSSSSSSSSSSVASAATGNSSSNSSSSLRISAITTPDQRDHDATDLPHEEIVARRDWTLRINHHHPSSSSSTNATLNDNASGISNVGYDGSSLRIFLDIGVPLMGGDEKLLQFFAPAFGRAVQEFHNKVNIKVNVDQQNHQQNHHHLRQQHQQHHQQQHSSRPIVHFRLLVSRYPSDDSSIEFQHAVAKAASWNNNVDNDDNDDNDVDVVFVNTNATTFHRAHAINLLHKNHIRKEGSDQHSSSSTTTSSSSSVLAITDVDMWIGPRFLFNAIKEVLLLANNDDDHDDHDDISSSSPPTGIMYFPIVFSEYRPSTVLLVEKMLGSQQRYSKHRGLWREYGHGMYAIAGDSARSFLMDEDFVKWGGEDGEFFSRAEKRWKIVRQREYDLIHKWHPKYCDSSFVTEEYVAECRDSRRKVEGSLLGRLLLQLKADKPEDFEELFLASRHVQGGRSDLTEVLALASTEYEPGRSPEDEEEEEEEEEELAQEDDSTEESEEEEEEEAAAIPE